MADFYENLVTDLFALGDVRINGDRPWDAQVHDPRFFRKALSLGTMGLGEAYMDGWWDCRALDEFGVRILDAGLRHKVPITPRLVLGALPQLLPNLHYFVPGLREAAARLGLLRGAVEQHYNIGNDFYKVLLDRRMTYTCGYWQDAETLDEAGEAKLEMVCRKLGLKPGHRVLDIGCGWASFARYAVEHYGVSVTGITISEEQRRLGSELAAGLPIEIRLQDYRDVRDKGAFDRAVSLGMFEHVGRRNYPAYMRMVHDALTPDGLFVLETIGENVSGTHCNPWFAKYVFNSPASVFPSTAEVSRSVEGLFAIEDWQNFGYDYAPTIEGWWANVEAERDWVLETYGERFYRLWEFCFKSCISSFRGRYSQMWQIVLAKQPVEGGFHPDYWDAQPEGGG